MANPDTNSLFMTWREAVGVLLNRRRPGQLRDRLATRASGGGAQRVFHQLQDYKFEKSFIIGEKGGMVEGNGRRFLSQGGIRDLQDGVSKDPRLCRANTPGCSKASPGASASTDGKEYWGGCGCDRGHARRGGIAWSRVAKMTFVTWN
jgi:hypothetical protein